MEERQVSICPQCILLLGYGSVYVCACVHAQACVHMPSANSMLILPSLTLFDLL